MKRRTQPPTLLLVLGLLAASSAAQVSERSPFTGDRDQPIIEVQTSPFPAPQPTDDLFVVDDAPGLDTGCTFSSGGPLVFDIDITRFVGDVAKLKANNLLGAQVVLTMPAFDVDSSAVVPNAAPEVDDVYLVNATGNHYLGSLKGLNNTWILNTFSFPVEWLEFPPDPGPGNTLTPQPNTIRIFIDVANSTEVWCTSIDWASLKIEATRPVLGVHGILSNGGIWTTLWQTQLQSGMGLPFDASLNMGGLDSIQSNAGKIGAKVAELKARWGVDKLTLVCHSKGGLDSRHYAETNDDIAKLIQIGTPNAGSPLADAAQAGLIAIQLLGGPSAILVNRLAGPAGVQLTQPYMALYNATHGHNSKTQYVSLGGDYDPNCSFFSGFQCALYKTLLFITGQGDTIVPLSSAYALPYAAAVGPYVSIGLGDTSATHTGLHMAPGVFNLLQGEVANTKRMPSRAMDPVRTVTEAGMVMTGGMQSFPILVDDPGPSSFTMLYPSGEDLDLILVSPTGIVYDKTTAPGNPNVVFGDGDILGGRSESYTFDTSTETGTWMATVFGNVVNDPSGAAGFMVTAILQNSTLVLDGAFAPANVNLGDALVLTGTLSDSSGPVLGSTVTAGIKLPDATVTTISLLDDGLGNDAVAGDGIYTGSLSPTTQVGVYDAVFRATDGSSYSREDMAMATVSASSSSITGPYSDMGLDTDGDGLFNELILDVGVDISMARQYRLLGELKDSQGNTLNATLDATLAAGAQTVQLSFDGAALFANQVDGPYEITRLVLIEDTGTDMLPADEVLSPHFTTAYSWTAFEHDSLVLTGTGMDVGVDTNGNGLFDTLQVDLDVLVEVPDTYTWSAILAAPDGSDIELQSGSGTLAQGPGVITFNFTGTVIQAAGVTGNYMVKDLLVFGTSESLAVTGAVYSTGFYCESQFEGFTHVGPVFDAASPCGSTYVLFPGDSLSLPFMASDSDCLHTVTLSASGLPPSATLTPTTPLSGNPVGTTLDWTPAPGEEGHYDIVLDATDDNLPGAMASCTIGVDYTANLAPVFTGASPCGQTLTATVGEPISFTIDVSDPNAGDIVTLSSTSLPPRATATPALPASGTAFQVQIDWVPLCADVGTRVITFDLVDDSPFPLSAQCQVTVSVQPPTSTRILRVDPGATGLANGATWADAYPDLQSALDEAAACGSDTEIWVSTGIYVPTKVLGLDPRSVSFSIPDGIRLYGGFAGGETSLSQRDPMANPAVLSGDINGDDLPGFLNVADNAFHVLTFANAGTGTLVDGFRVSGGNADGLFVSELSGGAVLVTSGAPTLRDVRFWFNRAVDKGGAIHADSGASLLVDQCEFLGNQADFGGGMSLVGSSAQIDNCSFRTNVAQTNGGGLHLDQASSATLQAPIFDGNAGNVGGGLNVKSSSVTVTGGSFQNNTAALWGGGAAFVGAGPSQVSGSSFDANTAQAGGGLMVDSTQMTLDLCTFDGNTATGSGGGVVLQAGASGTLTDCAFNLNQATTQGGGAFVSSSSATVSDGMFTSNSANRGGGIAASQAGLVLARGMFVSNTATDAGGAIRAGTSSTLSVTAASFSMNGATRGAGMQVVSSTLVLQGSSFADNTAGSAGGALELRTVTTGTIDTCDFDRNASADGGALYLTESSTPAITDCNFRDNTASASGGAVSVLVTSQPTFTDCLWANNSAAMNGGALRVLSGSAPTVVGSTFQGNSANRGGAVGNQDGGGSYTRCNFMQNSAVATGGAMDSRSDSSPVVQSSAFVANTAKTGGACMVADLGAPMFEACRFIGNTSTQWAGAFAEQSSGVTLVRNSMFEGNSSTSQGGALRVSSTGNLMLIGCTLGNNTSGKAGGLFDDGLVGVQSSILWGNSDNGGTDETAQVDFGPNAAATTGILSFTTVQGWTGALGGLGNDGVDPLFVNPTAGDLHLSFGSPAVNGADPTYVPAPGELDSDGEPRLEGAGLDRGADEQHDCNGNGRLDYQEVASKDCNGNSIPDDCDISSGFSKDNNGDGIPDECQTTIAPAGLQRDHGAGAPRPSPGG